MSDVSPWTAAFCSAATPAGATAAAIDGTIPRAELFKLSMGDERESAHSRASWLRSYYEERLQVLAEEPSDGAGADANGRESSEDFYRRINAEGHTRAAVTCPSCQEHFAVDFAGSRLGES